MRKHLFRWILLLTAMSVLAACSGPDAKKAKFFNKGKILYEKADYVKARLEFKNAAQIDPKYADPYRMLGLIDMKEGNFRGAYGLFSKAIELNPDDLDAHYQIGKLLLGAGQPDKALEKADLILKKKWLPCRRDATEGSRIHCT
jgi:tetratricopeptide (TPR) repeat protein